MKPAEYFERYGKDSHLEFFRGEDLPAGVPMRAGIYAWYGRIVVPDPDRARATDTAGLESLVREQIFARFQRQPYDITLSAALEPRFRGRVLHSPESLPPADGSADAISRAADAVSDFLARSFAPAFSAPIYVGKAVKQPLSSRIAQHLAGLREYLGRSAEYLETQRRGLLEDPMSLDPEEIDAHSFAIEAAVRRFSPSRLFLVTYAPPTINPADIGLLENVVNRINYPICGRR
jgi:hypothetical protein